ncbi:MAG: hypothetical protein JO167_05680, partial [Alphaproteobacteria bacterium]|nr:hypothetical protein [Alphaproteobacteria bacterium]
NPQTVKNRLGVYRNQTAPLLDYYGKQGKLVSVTMDTVAQIQSHLIAQQYEGLIKKAKLRGVRR